MRRFLNWIIIGLFCFSSAAVAQNSDSLAVMNGKWRIMEVQEGLRLRQIQFTDSSLFRSNQFISVLEIDKKVIGKKRGVYFGVEAREQLMPTSGIAREVNAAAAINGSFFALRKPYNSVDYIRVKGRVLAPNEYKGERERLFHQEGAVVIRKGKLFIGKPDGKEVPGSRATYSVLEWEKHLKGDDVITSGPLLRLNGKDEVLKTTSHFTTRHPRTVVARKRDGTVWLITIDGRAKEAAGMSLKEVLDVFRWLGADDILSLDGGGSTTMYLREKGVVNHPTDNKTFDSAGERKVANAIVMISPLSFTKHLSHPTKAP